MNINNSNTNLVHSIRGTTNLRHIYVTVWPGVRRKLLVLLYFTEVILILFVLEILIVCMRLQLGVSHGHVLSLYIERCCTCADNR